MFCLSGSVSIYPACVKKVKRLTLNEQVSYAKTNTVIPNECEGSLVSTCICVRDWKSVTSVTIEEWLRYCNKDPSSCFARHRDDNDLLKVLDA